MKKLLVLAMVAAFLLAGSAFATERHFSATPNATFPTPGVGGAGYAPTTTNNDDSCDISVAPAATLLLPYFEVGATSGQQTTLFTVTNVSRFPQIAHVTVWSEYSVPVLDFNLFLTGFDVQGINLYDVIFGGVIAPSATQNGSPTGFTSSGSTPGSMSAANTSNPNFATSIRCSTLPGNLPSSLVTAVQAALTQGIGGTGCTAAGTIGGNHAGVAKGYVTVDVANNCSTSLPTDAGYFSGEILFDNTLIGDFEQLGPVPVGGTSSTYDGAGNPMVHIRATPEGGPASLSSVVVTNLPYTFYDRYTAAYQSRRIDRRQPLPSAWAARYIENSGAGFATNYKIWREGKNAGDCTTAATLNNSSNWVSEIVRFDEAENPYSFSTNTVICSPNCTFASTVTLPEASLTATTNNAIYPQFASGASTKFGGWMYLNLSNGGSSSVYSVTGPGIPASPANYMNSAAVAPIGLTSSAVAGPRPSQNWVVIEMFGTVGTNKLTADFDAAWLGNGCSSAYAASGFPSSAGSLGPAGSGAGLVCPAGQSCGAAYTGTNTTP